MSLAMQGAKVQYAFVHTLIMQAARDLHIAKSAL
jgi:hypothetical protein